MSGFSIVFFEGLSDKKSLLKTIKVIHDEEIECSIMHGDYLLQPDNKAIKNSEIRNKLHKYIMEEVKKIKREKKIKYDDINEIYYIIDLDQENDDKSEKMKRILTLNEIVVTKKYKIVFNLIITANNLEKLCYNIDFPTEDEKISLSDEMYENVEKNSKYLINLLNNDDDIYLYENLTDLRKDINKKMVKKRSTNLLVR